MSRFARNSIAFLVSITAFTLIVRSQLPDPPQRKKELENPVITFSGKIPDGVNYTVRVSYWTTSASFFCTDFNIGSLIPFGFGGGQGRDAEVKVSTHHVTSRDGFHYAKIPLDSITGSCNWQPKYLDICLTKKSNSNERCIKLLQRTNEGLSKKKLRPLLEGTVLNPECDSLDWYLVGACFELPIDYNDYFSIIKNSSFKYNFRLAPQDIVINFKLLSLEQTRQRKTLFDQAHIKSISR